MDAETVVDDRYSVCINHLPPALSGELPVNLTLDETVQCVWYHLTILVYQKVKINAENMRNLAVFFFR